MILDESTWASHRLAQGRLYDRAVAHEDALGTSLPLSDRYSKCLACGGALTDTDRRTGLHSEQQPGKVYPPDPTHPNCPLAGKPRLCWIAYKAMCDH